MSNVDQTQNASYPFLNQEIKRGMQLHFNVSLGANIPMLLAALYDLGISEEFLMHSIKALKCPNYTNYCMKKRKSFSVASLFLEYQIEEKSEGCSNTVSFDWCQNWIKESKISPLTKARILKVYTRFNQAKATILKIDISELKLKETQCIKEMIELSLLALTWELLDPSTCHYTHFSFFTDLQFAAKDSKTNIQVLNQELLKGQSFLLKSNKELQYLSAEDRAAYQELDSSLAIAWLTTLAVPETNSRSHIVTRTGFASFDDPKNALTKGNSLICSVALEETALLETSSGLERKAKGYRLGAHFSPFELEKRQLRVYKKELFTLGAEDFKSTRSFDLHGEEIEDVSFWVENSKLEQCQKYLFLQMKVHKIGLSEETLHKLGVHEQSLVLGKGQRTSSIRIKEYMLQSKVIRYTVNEDDLNVASLKLGRSLEQCRVESIELYSKYLCGEGMNHNG